MEITLENLLVIFFATNYLKRLEWETKVEGYVALERRSYRFIDAEVTFSGSLPYYMGLQCCLVVVPSHTPQKHLDSINFHMCPRIFFG